MPREQRDQKRYIIHAAAIKFRPQQRAHNNRHWSAPAKLNIGKHNGNYKNSDQTVTVWIELKGDGERVRKRWDIIFQSILFKFLNNIYLPDSWFIAVAHACLSASAPFAFYLLLHYFCWCTQSSLSPTPLYWAPGRAKKGELQQNAFPGEEQEEEGGATKKQTRIIPARWKIDYIICVSFCSIYVCVCGCECL